MTPKPPSSSDGSSLPPRHRPNLGKLAKDTTEQDLWAFDEAELEAADEPAATGRGSIPKPREADPKAPRDNAEFEAPAPKPAPERVRVNVGKNRNPIQHGKSSPASAPGGDFDDLDEIGDWEADAEIAAPAGPVEISPEPAPVTDVPEEIVPSAPAPEPVSAAPAPALPATFQRLALSKAERIGLIALLAVLVIGGGIVFLGTISRLPTGSALAAEDDFPIEGAHATIVSAETFWRAPITTGENADTVRRDTQLIPVIDLGIRGGPAAIRVRFRNSEGIPVGDTITRMVREGEKIQVAATAGFDDVGMHAAYGTGQSKPWTVLVLEAPSAASEAREYKKLFATGISTERR